MLTQPDRRAGRGKRMTESPVKRHAAAQDIPVLQPESLRDAHWKKELHALAPDIMVVAAYGLLLPQPILDIPRAGCLNVHASLLPRWRGAAPIQAAILAGDEKTGVSLMAMTAGLDSGPVYARRETPIGATETAGQLHDRLAVLGGELLVQHLDAILSGSMNADEQDDSEATYARKIRKADAALDWQQPAFELERAVRAYNPVPGAYFEFGGKTIKCLQSEAAASVDAPPGTVVAAGGDGIVVSTTDGALKMLRLQRPGRRPVSAREFSEQLDVLGRRLG